MTSGVSETKQSTYVPADRPLLGLVMIVKNEAHGIAETLRSFKPAIDCWTVLDTGSTDGTQEIVRRELADLPGALLEEPFVDFSTTRNRALDLHAGASFKSVFTVMPDSDDRLEGAAALRDFCAKNAHGSVRSYALAMRYGNLTFQRPIVHRSVFRPHYVGRVHECLDVITHIEIPGVLLTQEKPAESYEATLRRWERDRDLLIQDMATAPGNGRTVFYLAQTYECLGEQDKAIELYQRRVLIGGWPEEVFIAKLRRAKLLTDEKERVHALLEAHAFDPRRAEPLYLLAQHYYDKQVHSLSYLFADRARKMREPRGALFSESDVYEWRAADTAGISAFYLARQLGDARLFAEGREAAEQAARAQPGDERVQQNRAFYNDGTLAPPPSEDAAPFSAQESPTTPSVGGAVNEVIERRSV